MTMLADIESLDLMRGVLQWKVRRTKRLVAEQQFQHFTGHVDMIELHVPYTQYQYFAEMVQRAENSKGKNLLVLAGDNMNLDLFSRYFHRSDERVVDASPYNELDTLIKLLRYAHDVYDRILYQETNHDKRMYKLIYHTMQEKAQAEEMCKFIKPIQDFFEENRLHKIVIAPDQLFQIGDVLITHFENNSKVPGSVPRQLVKYLLPRIQKTWQVVFQFHTHYQSKLPIMGKWCIEGGALCYSQDYWQQPKVKSEEKVPSIGYAQCDMVDGIVDVNSANFVWCAWDRWI